VQNDRFERWLETIRNTRDEEISCSACFDFVSQYVEVELSGEDAAAQMPQLRQHLDQCPACRAEYETLRDLQELENKGELPSLGDLQDSLP
jgi:hypothetical protein